MTAYKPGSAGKDTAGRSGSFGFADFSIGDAFVCR